MKRILIFFTGLICGATVAWLVLTFEKSESAVHPEQELNLVLIPLQDSVKFGNSLKMAVVPNWRSDDNYPFEHVEVKGDKILTPQMGIPYDSYSLFNVSTEPLMDTTQNDSFEVTISAKAINVFSEEQMVKRLIKLKWNDSIAFWGSGSEVIYLDPDG